MALSNQNQAAFWEAMKEKYEKRNENLRQQEICLRERLEQLKQLMEQQQTANDDCDCVPEKLEKPSLVQCLVQKGKELILGSCTCGDPKIGQEFLCACHIMDSKIPLDFDSSECPNQDPTSPDGCMNQECDFYNPQLANPSQDPSIFSLKSTDIYYMDKLAELVKTEKSMQNKITELENKERCYITALQDVNELMKKKPKNDPLRKEFDRIVECLEGENRKLKNELEDLRLELKHCFERVEGPLRRSLENQREKCADMEKKLKTFQEKMTNKEDNYLKEINEIKAKLCQACCTMVDLNHVNSRLKNDLVSLENKCLTLEDELVKQQLKEAENILKFKKVICRRSTPPIDSLNRGDDSEQDLEHIARKLSETLKEVYPCVNKVPTDLTETVKGIKQLTELVGEKEQRRKKRNGKGQSSVMPTTSQVESFCCCYNIDESNPESTIIVKRTSTAPPALVQDTGSEKLIKQETEITTDKPIVETASIACECDIELESRSQQTAPPESNPLKEVPAQSCAGQSVCSCPEDVSEKTSAEKKDQIPKTVQPDSRKQSVASRPEDVSQKTPLTQEPIPKIAEDTAQSVCSCPDEVSVKTGKSEQHSSKTVQIKSEYSCPGYDEARKKPGAVGEEAQSNCACGDQELTNEQTAEKASKNDEDEIPSNCSCEEQESKRTGPSEEVIAVKNLDSVCPSGVCNSQHLKLMVDTKCDIVDVPAKDIHVVTTLAKTGSLEIRTEGPPGIIETKVNYLPGGKIEIVTKLIDRTNMSSFLQGTLLPLPEQPPDNTCDDSETCGGQCEISSPYCENQEGDSKKPSNETKTSNQLSSAAPYGSVNIQNNFVLLGGTRIDHLIQNEWKNANFASESKEEFETSNLVSSVKRMHTNKEHICSEEDLNKEFRLSSRPSLTDIEKYSSENGVSGESLNGFMHPDALETISEGDEEEHSTRNDLKLNSERSCEEEQAEVQSDACCNTSKDVLGDFDTKEDDLSDACCNTSKDAIGDFNFKDEDLSDACFNTSQDSIGDFNSKNEDSLQQEKVKEVPDQLILQNHDQSVTMGEENTAVAQKHSLIAEDCSSMSNNDDDSESLHNTTTMEKVEGSYSHPEKSLCGNGDICTRIHSEEHSSGSFCHLYRNLGNINLLRGNFRLRQTRSLYENKRRGTECLRVCKSAVVNLGTLKIDIEMIKFIPGRPKVGDFDDKEAEDKERRDCKISRSPVLEIENSKEPEYLGDIEINPLDCKKGFKSPDCFEMIPEQIVQCYVCNCPKKEEKKDESEAIRPPATENLEERIDRLLQINPFASSHGPNCQCVDCLVHNAETDTPRPIPPVEGCKCPKKSKEKTSNAYQEQHRCKCTLLREDMPLSNELGKQGDTPFHGENCTCVDCLCDPSKFKPSKTGLQCDCQDCKCDTCYDSAKNPLANIALFQLPKPPEITVMNVSIPCDCGKTCSCNPCFDPKVEATKAKSQAVEKTCANNDPKNRQSVTNGQTANDPFNNRDTWQTVVGCYPSSSNKKEVCDCKVCECKPCGYKGKARKPCDCRKPPKEQQPDNEDQKKKGKCNSTTCASNKRVPSAFGDASNKNKIYASMPEVSVSKSPYSKKECGCVISECVFCSESEAEGLTERIREECSVYEKPCEKKYVSPLTVEPCDRSKCSCGPKRPSRVENVKPSKQPEKAGEVSPEKKESVKSEPVDPKPKTEESPKQSESEHEDKQEDRQPEEEKQEDRTSEDEQRDRTPEDDKQEERTTEHQPETCHCSVCTCDPCKKTDLKDKQHPEDGPTEASKTENANPDEQKPSEDQAQGDKTKEPKTEEVKSSIPCDCSNPCPCSPCADPKVVCETPQPIGDADTAKNEIRSLLDKISCTCNKAENDFKPLMKQASNFESTVSKMKLKLNNLEQKCKDKDQIINAMTKDLRMRSQSGVFANLLHDMAHPKERFVPDFNRSYVSDFLPKPRPVIGSKLQPKRSSTSRTDNRLEPILELDRYLPGGNEDMGRYRRNLDASGLEIIDIRRVTIDSILIKWRSPCNLTGITGYQIFVNDELKYKVLSPNRTTAVLDTLELSRSLEIMLFAMSTSGRCEPPALATYKI